MTNSLVDLLEYFNRIYLYFKILQFGITNKGKSIYLDFKRNCGLHKSKALEKLENYS